MEIKQNLTTKLIELNYFTTKKNTHWKRTQIYCYLVTRQDPTLQDLESTLVSADFRWKCPISTCGARAHRCRPRSWGYPSALPCLEASSRSRSRRWARGTWRPAPTSRRAAGPDWSLFSLKSLSLIMQIFHNFFVWF